MKKLWDKIPIHYRGYVVGVLLLLLVVWSMWSVWDKTSHQYQAPHQWGFLFIKWFNFHYRYTGRVSFIEDSQPALGAGGREFESLHPDSTTIPVVSYKALGKLGGFLFTICYHTLSFITKKWTQKWWTHFFQFNLYSFIIIYKLV